MPSFPTPTPVTLVVDVSVVDLRVRAEDTTSTSVEVRPHSPSRQGDVDLAARTTVEHTGDRVSVRGPRTVTGRLRGLLGGGDRVDVEVVVPRGSALDVRGAGELVTTGELGAVVVDTSMGDISLDRVARVDGRTALGDIRVEHVAGDADLRTSTGTVTIHEAGGAVVARAAVGDVSVGDGGGHLRLTTSTGNVRVEHARDGVTANASAGDVRVHHAHGGAVSVDSSFGRVDVGVPHGVAAWLDIEARHGTVRSELSTGEAPAAGDPTVEIRVRAGFGDIVLHRV